MSETQESDICLIVEGAYPFVVGGVSSWLQDLILSMPDLRFSLVAIKAGADVQPWRMVPPANVVEVVEIPLLIEPCLPRRYPAPQMKRIGRMLLAFLSTGGKEELIRLRQALEALKPAPAAGDLLSNPEIFDLFTHYYDTAFRSASFHHFFWAMRVLLGGLLKMLLAPLPRARVYHTISTGFAGLLAARAAYETGHPAFITEHGIYMLERQIEIMMADWIGDQIETGLTLDREGHDLRDLWLAVFQTYTRACYDACDPIIALYGANNRTQRHLGARQERLRVIPNGIDADRFALMERACDPARPLVALIGRVVPIKDIKTFIRAAALVVAEMPEVRFAILGPLDEDPDYAADCEALVTELGVGNAVQFAGRVNVAEWLPRIDLIVLTSLSEAQPLVILEGGACGVPVVAPDVGSCREMIEGRSPAIDRPGGIVTQLVNPECTAAAILDLLRAPSLRRAMGEALRERVVRDYDRSAIIAEYRHIYSALGAQARFSELQ
ncbi:GT4 family glycosyltransferase PelF [Sphingobium chlorophenolicum]|uniref:Glycosyl transferase family 1 n=1 Tax=Sphingobium chlorophenolicum TaxID=46429 RepID=A0A081RE80_SPHCR|nr:GT4 family glycosyltransferase PelF [Sphingobium chlorophenolicum]KEQ53503.1 Glycosyl transferase family 1 [Sphingobium chlorophenolicum]